MAFTQSAMMAKEIRSALKVAFPEVKFSVRSSTYSINVKWTDFPTVKAVELIVKQYENVDRCEISGEVLSGGNTFVFCSNEWTEDVRSQIESKVPECFDKNDYEYGRWFNKTAQKMYEEMKVENEVLEITTEEAATIVSETVEVVDATSITTQEQNNAVNASYALNEALNGVEIRFEGKPEQEVIDKLNASEFRWSGKKKLWWAKQTSTNIEFAKSLCETQGEAETAAIPLSYPDIDIEDIEVYTVDQNLQDREHDQSFIFRKDKIDRTQEIQNIFQDWNDKVKETLSKTDSERIAYYLKKSLQSCKKQYFDNFVTTLRHRAANPSWAVTGRSGLNERRYNKASDRYAKLINESVEIANKMEYAITKAQREIRQEKERSVRSKMAQMDTSIHFQTERRTTTFNRLTETLRVYVYGEYMIAKTWGCYRIFKDGKEIHGMKSKDKLDDAKRYVSMLVSESVAS